MDIHHNAKELLQATVWVYLTYIVLRERSRTQKSPVSFNVGEVQAQKTSLRWWKFQNGSCSWKMSIVCKAQKADFWVVEMFYILI